MITLLGSQTPPPDNTGLFLILAGIAFLTIASVMFLVHTKPGKSKTVSGQYPRAPQFQKSRVEMWEHQENTPLYHRSEANYGRTRCSICGAKVSK